MPSEPARARPIVNVFRAAARSAQVVPSVGRNHKALALLLSLLVAGVAPIGGWFTLPIVSEDAAAPHQSASAPIYSDDRLTIRLADLPSPQADDSLQAATPATVAFYVYEDGLKFEASAAASTVAEALAAIGVHVDDGDIVQPPLDSPLKAGVHIHIQHFDRVEVAADGDLRSIYTRSRTVGAVLAEAGITVEPLDKLSHSPEAAVTNGMRVTVTRVDRETVEESEPIPYETVYVTDASLEPGKRRVEPGSEGTLHREVLIVYENGVEVSRSVVREWVDPEPKDEVVSIGPERPAPVYVEATPATAAAEQQALGVAAASTVPTSAAEAGSGAESEPECSRTLTVYATWYNAASSGKPRGSPGYGITATGVPVTKGIVAVDPKVIPLGTRMYVPGYGYAVAADTGGAIKGNIIDLGYPDGAPVDWRSRYVDVCILS